MRLGILVRRLLLGKRYVSSEELEALCNRLGLNYYAARAYLVANNYAKRIVRGFFYVPTIEERKLRTGGPDPLEAMARAMEYKKANWHFGLETAIKLNLETHEHFAVDYVVSDSVFRAKPITVLGRKIKFVKLKKSLLGFGVKKKGLLKYSDLEKTLLDIAYVKKYRGESDESVKSYLSEWAEHASKKKLEKYAKHYGNAVRKIAGELK